MTRIKICGIKEESHAIAVAKAGADFIGLVFATSRRQITTRYAKKIIELLRRRKNPTEVVGVFVNTEVGKVNRIANFCGLDWVQLSGNEPWEFCRELNRPVIKAIRVSRNYRPEKIIKDLSYGEKLLARQKHMFLIDSNSPDRFGGTGQPFNWKLARPIAERFPVIIAGGLTPQNVEEAVRIIKPWGVDVSTGVETRGTKDLDKILKFINTVKNTDKEIY
jgi:phosphoribosylanthranilate isomerase